MIRGENLRRCWDFVCLFVCLFLCLFVCLFVCLVVWVRGNPLKSFLIVEETAHFNPKHVCELKSNDHDDVDDTEDNDDNDDDCGDDDDNDNYYIV